MKYDKTAFAQITNPLLLPVISQQISVNGHIDNRPSFRHRFQVFTNRLLQFVRFWLPALKAILPLFIGIHLVLLVISLYAPTLLFQSNHSHVNYLPNAFSVLWACWNRFDSVYYLQIAKSGYMNNLRLIPFFPFYSLLIHILMFFPLDIRVTGLLISSLAGLVLMMVLFQYAKEEWGERMARRAVLAMVVFPTAFFLWAIYPESLFMCLSFLCFYAMRHQRWWLAGCFGLLACLTRPNGIFLCAPFCIEYLRQHQFHLSAVRWNALSSLLIPLGLGIFSLYCYLNLGDALAFQHAQASWKRSLHMPLDGTIETIQLIVKQPNWLQTLLTESLDLFPAIFALLLLLLGIVGPWRLQSRYRAEIVYGLLLWLFATSFPAYQPLMGTGRNMLVIFPLFLILAQLGRNRWFYLIYVSLSSSLCFFWLIQFLTGYRVI